MKKFTIGEIEQMAKDLTVDRPQFGQKPHNTALQMLVDRAKLLSKKEKLEGELEENNVIDINSKKKGGK